VSDRDRLHGLIDVLPDETIAAILTLVDPPGRVLTNEEFAARMAEISAEEGEELDEETAAAILAGEAEDGPYMTLEELMAERRRTQ
jgi:ssDNA-binding replication factor A large subunit